MPNAGMAEFKKLSNHLERALMAKTELNAFEKQLKEIDADIASREKELAKLQDQLRLDPYNAGIRTQVQDAKRALIPLAEERGELARGVSRLAGGKQFMPPV